MNGIIFSKISPTSIRQNKNEKEYQNPSLIMGNQSMLINLKNDMWQNSVIQCVTPISPLVAYLNELKNSLLHNCMNSLNKNFSLSNTKITKPNDEYDGPPYLKLLFILLSSDEFSKSVMKTHVVGGEVLQIHAHGVLKFNQLNKMELTFHTLNSIHFQYNQENSYGMEKMPGIKEMIFAKFKTSEYLGPCFDCLRSLLPQAPAPAEPQAPAPAEPQAPAPAEPQAPPPAEPK